MASQYAYWVCPKCKRRILRPYPNEFVVIDKKNDCGGEMELEGMYIPRAKKQTGGIPHDYKKPIGRMTQWNPKTGKIE